MILQIGRVYITTHSIHVIPHLKGAYRCLILDCDLETATFQKAKNKRLINAVEICLHPRRFTPYRDSANDMHQQI